MARRTKVAALDAALVSARTPTAAADPPSPAAGAPVQLAAGLIQRKTSGAPICEKASVPRDRDRLPHAWILDE